MTNAINQEGYVVEVLTDPNGQPTGLTAMHSHLAEMDVLDTYPKELWGALNLNPDIIHALDIPPRSTDCDIESMYAHVSGEPLSANFPEMDGPMKSLIFGHMFTSPLLAITDDFDKVRAIAVIEYNEWLKRQSNPEEIDVAIMEGEIVDIGNHFHDQPIYFGESLAYDVPALWVESNYLPVQRHPTRMVLEKSFRIGSSSFYFNYTSSDWEKVASADMRYPIILLEVADDRWKVLDGHHRLVRALITNTEYMECQIFTKTPKCFNAVGDLSCHGE